MEPDSEIGDKVIKTERLDEENPENFVDIQQLKHQIKIEKYDIDFENAVRVNLDCGPLVKMECDEHAKQEVAEDESTFEEELYRPDHESRYQSVNTSSSKRVIHSQGREIIYNVYKFMQTEKERQAVTIPLCKLQKRVAIACAVGINTVKSIINEAKNKAPDEPFKSPRRTINKPLTSKGSVDEFEEDIIRKIIYSYTAIHKRRPTMKMIYDTVKKEKGIHFKGKIDSFRELVRKMGFRWRKAENNSKVLVEKFEIKSKRLEYLRKLKGYEREGRTIIYCGETYIYAGKSKCLKLPASKGRRFFILHAGGSSGFVPNALNIITLGNKMGDEMNSTNFTQWLKDKFIPNAPERCVLVLHNASYNNVLVHPIPNFSWKKTAMQLWLTDRGILHEANALKAELYTLIEKHKPTHKSYIVDTLLAQHNISTLRLPPYHPELNPIEKIWTILKKDVAAGDVPLSVAQVRRLIEEKLQRVTIQNWQDICDHVEKIEDEFIKREHIMDEVQESIIDVGADTSESESELSDNETTR